MAYVDISPIKSEKHLSNAISYILKNEKTNDRYYTDAYKCVNCPGFAEFFFRETRDKEVIDKGNNLAWHIEQSFSPEDNVTPEMALEIGKELMKRYYPNYQYVIATHIDKEHIHNHIILNSVNFVDFHKLVSNKKTRAELRKTSDDICKEYGLSVIDPTDKNHRKRLCENIDKAISKSADFYDFIENMQELGYAIKKGNNYLKYKDKNMKNFMRADSVSLDYTEARIKYRIKTQTPPEMKKRTVYDNKIKYNNMRKFLKSEIDSSIKKVNSFDEFLNDMNDRGIEVKRGKHISFKSEHQKAYIRGRSIDKELSYHYTEEVIRFRIEHKEVYNKMSEERLKKVITKNKKWNNNLWDWAIGENSQTKTYTNSKAGGIVLGIAVEDGNRIVVKDENTLGASLKDLNSSLLTFGLFLEKYDKKKAEKDALNDKINEINSIISDSNKMIKAVQKYWESKKMVDGYMGLPENSLDDYQKEQLTIHKREITRNTNIMNELKDKGYPTSISVLRNLISDCKDDIKQLRDDAIRLNLEFEEYETIKYNFNSEDGFNYSDDEAREFAAGYYNRKEYEAYRTQVREDRKEKIKTGIKNILGINK